MKRPTQEASGAAETMPDPLPRFKKLEPAHAASVVSFTRICCQTMTAFVGTDLAHSNELDDPVHGFLKSKRPADAPATTSARKRQKNRNKNRFSALGDDETMEETPTTTAAAQLAPAPSCQRPAVVSTIMRDRELREGLQRFMTDSWFCLKFHYEKKVGNLPKVLF